MKKTFLLSALLLCGYSARGNELEHPTETSQSPDEDNTQPITVDKPLLESDEEIAFVTGATLFHFLNGFRIGIDEALANSDTTGWGSYLCKKFFLVGTPCLLQGIAAYLYDVPYRHRQKIS